MRCVRPCIVMLENVRSVILRYFVRTLTDAELLYRSSDFELSVLEQPE